MPRKAAKNPALGDAITHPSQLKKAAVYFANGRLARYTGREKRCAPLFTLRPVFSAHGETFTAKISTVYKVAKGKGAEQWAGVRVYMGRNADEPLGGINERVRESLMHDSPLPTRKQPREYLLALFRRWKRGE